MGVEQNKLFPVVLYHNADLSIKHKLPRIHRMVRPVAKSPDMASYLGAAHSKKESFRKAVGLRKITPFIV